jgi:urocanate hydratase
VADGSPLAAAKIERVLSNDPGLGVLRHIDSGDGPNGEQILADNARCGVRLPSWD